MFKFLSLALLVFLWGASAFSQFSADRAFEVENGIRISDKNFNEKAYVLAGDDDPSQAPGAVAPIGSVYYQTNGETWKKTGAGVTDWSQQGLGSPVISQTADFGKNGNATSGSFLNRAGNVPSNVVGIPITVNDGVLQSVFFANENTITGTIKVYESDGVTSFLLYDLQINNSKRGSASGLTVPVTADRELSIQTSANIKNAGVTLAIKGLSQ